MRRSPELAARLLWFVRLRWMAVAVIAALALATGPWLGWITSWPALLVIAGLLAVANGVCLALARRPTVAPALAAAQIATDLVLLTFLIHYSGGVENPFLAFYLFHVIIGAMLLTRAQSWAVAAGAALLIVLLAVGEGSGLCPHHPLGLVTNWQDPRYVWGVTGVSVATLFVAAYLATNVMEGLRAKDAELRGLHERLADTEKLAAIGQLAAGVAHDLNTPLASIGAYAEELADLVRSGEANGKLVDYSDVIRRQTERCKGITQGLLGFARPATLKVYRVDVNYAVQEALEFLRFKRPTEGVAIEVRHRAEPSPFVLADPAQLLQVLLSVLTNALDAIGERGRIAVEIRREAGRAIVEVSDDGPGIPAELRERVFEPFFTTKEVGKGTGLGLPISRDLLKRYDGDISIDSSPGRGTIVRLTLPEAA